MRLTNIFYNSTNANHKTYDVENYKNTLNNVICNQ